MRMIEILGIDADDTLWDEVSHFDRAEQRFVTAVSPWVADSDVRASLRELHFNLIAEVGYGPTGYRKAMDAFCDRHLAGGAISEGQFLVEAIYNELASARLEAMPGVDEALARLRQRFSLVLITKGDVDRQRAKLEQSGLSSAFDEVVIVPEKHRAIYTSALGQGRSVPHAAMIGNSLKSDVLPAIAAGAYGIHVPHHRTSPLEEAPAPLGHPLFRSFVTLSEAADWLLA